MTQDERQHPSVTDGLKTVSYASNGTGRVDMTKGDGWQPVNEVNGQAWREIEQRIDRARTRVASGRASCLYYYMIANQMSPWLLARYTRQSLLAVLLHLLPFFFKRLKTGALQKYADLFRIAAEDLVLGKLPPAASPSFSEYAKEHSS